MSFPRFDVNLPLTVTRRVVVEDGGDVTVTDHVNEAFRGRIYLSNVKRTHPPRDTSMRSSLFQAHDILWFKPGNAVSDALRSGDRVSDGLDEYEALTGIRPKRAGTKTLIQEVWVASVDSLYPILAQLRALGSDDQIGPDVPCFVWEESETDTSRGTYRRLSAEVPVEFYDALSGTNRELVVAGKVHHIDQVTRHLGQPHVTATLRLKA